MSTKRVAASCGGFARDPLQGREDDPQLRESTLATETTSPDKATITTEASTKPGVPLAPTQDPLQGREDDPQLRESTLATETTSPDKAIAISTEASTKPGVPLAPTQDPLQGREDDPQRRESTLATETTSPDRTITTEASTKPGVPLAPTQDVCEILVRPETSLPEGTATPEATTKPGVPPAQTQHQSHGISYQPQPVEWNPLQVCEDDSQPREPVVTILPMKSASPDRAITTGAATKPGVPLAPTHIEDAPGEQAKGGQREVSISAGLSKLVSCIPGLRKLKTSLNKRDAQTHSIEEAPGEQAFGGQQEGLTSAGISNLEACQECEKLKTSLNEKDAQIRRLQEQLTAEMRIQEGNLENRGEKEFSHYFNHTIDKSVSNISDKEEKRKAKEHLCALFQMVYDYMMLETHRDLQRKLSVYLAVEKQQDADRDGNRPVVDEHTLEQMNRAYARLLLASGLVHKCPFKEEICQLLNLKGMASRSKIPLEQLKHCMDKAVEAAWCLITSIPPKISSCEPIDHLDDNLHVVVGKPEHPPEDGIYKLIYSRPVLYTSCARIVVDAGRVRIAQPDEATTMGDYSVLKRGSAPNSSGTKMLGDVGTLTLKNVMDELKDVRDWYSLGLKLKLPKEVVEKLIDEGRSGIIRQWLEMDGATWESLSTALADVGEKDAAEKVRKYSGI